MANSSLAKKRKVRSLEAQRDALLQTNEKNKIKLAQVRAELSLTKKGAA